MSSSLSTIGQNEMYLDFWWYFIGSLAKRNICAPQYHNCISDDDYVHCSFACLIPFGSLKIRSYVVNPVVISLFSSSASLSHTASLARSNCDCYQDRLFSVHYFRLPCVRVCVHIQLKCLCGQCTSASQPISSYRSHSDAC